MIHRLISILFTLCEQGTTLFAGGLGHFLKEESLEESWAFLAMHRSWSHRADRVWKRGGLGHGDGF